MTLYLYKMGTATPTLTIENVESYTDNRVVTTEGEVYGPLAECFELSSLPDCSESLRAAWTAQNPPAEARLAEVEALLAGLLFGGESV